MDLADQSAQSAENIKNVFAKLLADAESSVEVMKTLSENFHAQSEQITRTQVDMNEMSEKVTSVAQSADEIAARVRDLNASKESLLNIVSDLSAVSEENAASTEETNATMHELHATYRVNADRATSHIKKIRSQCCESFAFLKNGSVFLIVYQVFLKISSRSERIPDEE